MGGKGLQGQEGEGSRRLVQCDAAHRDDEVRAVTTSHPQGRRRRTEDHVHRREEGPPRPALQGGRVRGAPGGGRCRERRGREVGALAVRLPSGGPGLGRALLGTTCEPWVHKVGVGAGRVRSRRKGDERGGARRRLPVGGPGRGLGLGAEGDAGQVRAQDAWAVGLRAQRRAKDRHAGADHRADGQGHHLAGRPQAPEVAGRVLRDGREHEDLEQERVRRGAGARGAQLRRPVGRGVLRIPGPGGPTELHGSGQPVAAVPGEGDLQEHGQAEGRRLREG